MGGVDFRRGCSKLFFEGIGEMGKILESQVQVNIRRKLALFRDQVVGFFQASLQKPTAGGLAKDLFKVPFKSGKTPAGEVCKSLQLDVEMKVLLHKGREV